MAHPIPPYGVAIQDAIASGDVDKMKSVADDAQNYLKEFGEIGDGLSRLKAEIDRLGGGGSTPQPLYAPAIRYVIESDDIGKMKAFAEHTQDSGDQTDEVRSALAELQQAITDHERQNG